MTLQKEYIFLNHYAHKQYDYFINNHYYKRLSDLFSVFFNFFIEVIVMPRCIYTDIFVEQ